MTTERDSYDAIVIGAGVSGLYQLYRLREQGMSVLGIEAGSGVGGTWYWNRYPGARFDSESYSYGYSWSEELLEDWDWTEHFSPQPETLRYLSHVAERFGLNELIRFSTRVERASFDEDTNRWSLRLDDGTTVEAQFLVTALGALSAKQMPDIAGIDDFEGPSWHTSEWPHEPVQFEGKRVGVIGTGATAVQLIQEVAKTADHLTVFQRRPNWCAPLHNSEIDPAEQAGIKARYDEIFEACNASYGGFIHDSLPQKAMEVSEQERLDTYERLYDSPGFGIWMGNYRDVLVDEAANRTLSDFVAMKIRERVDDPAIAEKLIPTDHGFGTRRVPMETNYYEVYNQDNVTLVDLRETPIERVTPAGIRCGDREHELDLIVYATGFDAVTGSYDKIDFSGVGGARLRDAWAEGPKTYLGVGVPGFPNMFMVVGPHNASTFCNQPRCIEQNVEWVADAIGYARSHGIERFEATVPAMEAWTEHVYESVERLLMSKVDSWFMGINRNQGKTERNFLLYAGGMPSYRQRCDEVAANGYDGFALV